MSSVDQSLRTFGDVFCWLYDRLDVGEFRRDYERWSHDAGLESISAAVEADVRAGAPVSRILLRTENAGDGAACAFACLRGLDRAFAEVGPDAALPCPPGLRELRITVAATGRLDTGAVDGALLVRRTRRGEVGQMPDHPRDAFAYVVRVPEASWAAGRLHLLGEDVQPTRPELVHGLRIATAPLIADPDELRFEVVERGARRFYRIAPRELAVTRTRIAQVIERWDRSGVQIGIVPELTLTPALLEFWQKTLRARHRAGSRLLLVLAGTGDLTGRSRPANTAVLLNGRTGEEILRQDKLFPFNLTSSDVVRWGLDGRLGARDIDEDLEPGATLQVLEVHAGLRAAILVCEDLGRTVDLAAMVRDFGISLLLVPVFARPTRDRRWERAAADVHARATGATIVVANSLVMRTLVGGPPGTCLVVWPGAGDALVGPTEGAEDVFAFTLHPDGSAS